MMKTKAALAIDGRLENNVLVSDRDELILYVLVRQSARMGGWELALAFAS